MERLAIPDHQRKAPMRANNPKILIPVLLAIVFVAIAVSLFAGGKPYSTDLEDLKKQFNNDRGKVRLVMLLSPT